MNATAARGNRSVERRKQEVEMVADPTTQDWARNDPTGPDLQPATPQPIVEGTSGRRLTSLLLAGGVVGPPLFVLVFLIEGATRPGYSAWRNFVSQLATGAGGWTQVANFLVCGCLALGFAVGLRRALRAGRGATWGPLLLGVYGAGLIVAGCFATDPALGYPPGVPAAPQTLHGTVHGVAGLVVFSALTAACFVLAWRCAGERRGRGWAVYSAITGVLVAVFVVASFATSALDTRGSWPDAPTGLLQRIAIVLGWSWITLFALRLLRRDRSITAG